MSKAAVAPLNAEVGRVLALIDSLTDTEWNAPSGCAGWRVQEVVAHMGAVYRSICGDPSIPSDPSGDAERRQDRGDLGRSHDRLGARRVSWPDTILQGGTSGCRRTCRRRGARGAGGRR